MGKTKERKKLIKKLKNKDTNIVIKLKLSPEFFHWDIFSDLTNSTYSPGFESWQQILGGM